MRCQSGAASVFLGGVRGLISKGLLYDAMVGRESVVSATGTARAINICIYTSVFMCVFCACVSVCVFNGP